MGSFRVVMNQVVNKWSNSMAREQMVASTVHCKLTVYCSVPQGMRSWS